MLNMSSLNEEQNMSIKEFLIENRKKKMKNFIEDINEESIIFKKRIEQIFKSQLINQKSDVKIFID